MVHLHVTRLHVSRFSPVAAFAALAVAAGCSRTSVPAPAASNVYAPPNACAACHQDHAKTYAATGMARAFYRATPQTMTVEDFSRELHHKPSDRYYRMIRRDGRFFLRRHQTGFSARETNVEEKEIHYVMGSGNRTRSYIHRTPANRLLELPVAWYAERGGFLAMSPGYDRPNHPGFRRQIGYDCMFCHNAYPDSTGGPRAGSDPVFPAPMPEGIDCQRCHGPGAAHVAKAAAGDTAAAKTAIVNPAKLTAERQLEICMQCHLETTSEPLPNSIVRYGRGAFSYRPGEPLGDFMLFFDHAKGAGREEKFEIVNSAYRLRQSACFERSNGKLLCTTCHNPHDVPRGPAAANRYAQACLQCHAAGSLSRSRGHTAGAGCASCHMPRRRTEDVIHAVMTDHRIQRRPPPGDLLAPRQEREAVEGKTYRGEVELYYPQGPSAPADAALYTAMAQVVQKSNLEAGLPRLEAAVNTAKPREPEFYFNLAQAHRAAGHLEKAIAAYRRALEVDSRFLPAMRSLGAALLLAGRTAEAIAALEGARVQYPHDASLLHELGRALHRSGRDPDAAAVLRAAVSSDPDFPDAHNTLAGVYFQLGDLAQAEASCREALRKQPDYAEAHANLGNVLSSTNRAAEAEYHFQAAIRHMPALATAHYGYATLLAAREQYEAARQEASQALRLAPTMPEAHELLGNLHSQRGDWPSAIAEFGAALETNPEFARARVGLGAALLASGDAASARRELERAVRSGDAAARAEATEILGKMK